MANTDQNPLRIRKAVNVLRRGGVIAYPTEGVWGLGCDPYDRQAVTALLTIKGRSIRKGLILVGADAQQFAPFTQHLSDSDKQKLFASRDYPVTWIVPDHGVAPKWITGQHHSVAIRVSDHPLVKALCKAFGAPLVSTSANPEGRRPAISQLQVRRYFNGRLNYILPGQTLPSLIGRTSEIRDLVSNETIRPST